MKYHGDNKPRYPNLIANGLWEYRPDFDGDLWKKGAALIENIQANQGALARLPRFVSTPGIRLDPERNVN